MRLQVVSEEEAQEEELRGHESNGIALHNPPEDAEPAVDESEPEPALPPESELEANELTEPESIDDQPATESATDQPATNPSDDGISPDEMPSREGASTTMEEPVVGASRSDRWELHVNEIREQDRAVALAENEWNAAKEEAKNKKAAWEVAVAELREVIRRGPEQPSLFSPPPPVVGVETVDESPTTETESSEIEEPEPEKPKRGRKKKSEQSADTPTGIVIDPTSDESWKSTPIVELEILGLAKGIIGKLLDAGITTLSELASWSTEYRSLSDVPGLGPAKVAKVEDALERFWKERNNGN